METSKTTSDKLTIVIPLKETCGESMETAIEISGVHFNQIIPIETSIIHYLMDDMHWTKAEQSLIFANNKKYDKIFTNIIYNRNSLLWNSDWYIG